MTGRIVCVLQLCLISFEPSLFALNLQAPARQASAPTGSVRQVADSGRNNFSPLLIQQLEEVKVAALTDDYAYRQLAHLSENIGARPSGSASAKAAVDYVAAQMRDLGLKVRLEEVKVPHWERGVETAEITEAPVLTSGVRQKIILTALGKSTSTGSDGLTGDVVVADTFDELSAFGRKQVEGKIVLFNRKFDMRKVNSGMAFAAYRESVAYRQEGPRRAAELGAAAALVRSLGSAEFRLPHTGDNDAAGIPAAALSAEDADLIDRLAVRGRVRLHLVLTPRKLPDEASYNVIGDLVGNEHPEQIVIISAHLDSWDLGTGAIDDAAGVAVVLEVAQLLGQVQLHPKRTLRIIAWMDEENDGSGSSQYVQENHQDFTNHMAAIESDAGVAHPLGFAMKMSPAAVSALRPVQTVLAGIGATVFDETAHPPGVTDIAPLSDEGVPILGILTDMRHYYDYHHTAADTLDKVDPLELRENAAVMAVMAFALANMENPLPR